LKRVQRFEINTHGRDWVVGDIHGCFSVLENALDRVGFDRQNDRLFSVGDLVDRGPDSVRALEFLPEPWFHAVRGNHEQLLLETNLDDRAAVHFWWANGGGWFFAEPESVRVSLRQALSTLPYLIEVETEHGTVGIVHADVPRGQTWPEFSTAVLIGEPDALETALWGRSRALGRYDFGVEGIDRVYLGHTPVFDGVLPVGNVRCIDTGAVYGLRDGTAGAGLALMPLLSEEVLIEPALVSEPQRMRLW
jgi:serine/threonine protein phosphatase 1